MLGDYYDPAIGTFTTDKMFLRLGYVLKNKLPLPPAREKALIAFRVREGFRHMVYWDGYGMRDPGYLGREWRVDEIDVVYVLAPCSENLPQVARVGVSQPATNCKV